MAKISTRKCFLSQFDRIFFTIWIPSSFKHCRKEFKFFHIKCQKCFTIAEDIFCHFKFCHNRKNNFLSQGWMALCFIAFFTLKYQEVIYVQSFWVQILFKIQNCVWSGNCTIAVSPSHFESCVNFANIIFKVPTTHRFTLESNKWNIIWIRCNHSCSSCPCGYITPLHREPNWNFIL